MVMMWRCRIDGHIVKVIKWSLVYYHLTTFFDLFYDAGFGDYVHNESLVIFIPSNIRLNSKFT